MTLAAKPSSPAVGRYVPSNSSGKALGLSDVGFPEPITVGVQYRPHINQAWVTWSLLEPGLWPAPPVGSPRDPSQEMLSEDRGVPASLAGKAPLSGNCI